MMVSRQYRRVHESSRCYEIIERHRRLRARDSRNVTDSIDCGAD
jgi:hypothetical protein